MTEEEFIQKFELAVEADDVEAASQACEDFILINPNSPLGFWKRGTLAAWSAKFIQAVKEIDQAIRLKPDEATYFFFRGWWNLEAGNFNEAETDESVAINLEKSQDQSFVTESAYFFRALARLQQRRYDEALSDADQVSSDFMIYLKSKGKVTVKGIKDQAESRLNS